MAIWRGTEKGLIVPERRLYRGEVNLRPQQYSVGDFTEEPSVQFDSFTTAAWNPDAGANASGFVPNALGTGNLWVVNQAGSPQANWNGEMGAVTLVVDAVNSTALVTGSPRTITFWHLRRANFGNFVGLVAYAQNLPTSSGNQEGEYMFRSTVPSYMELETYIQNNGWHANLKGFPSSWVANQWDFYSVKIGANNWDAHFNASEVYSGSWLGARNLNSNRMLAFSTEGTGTRTVHTQGANPSFAAYGRYADIRVHNKALSQSEISALYAAGRQSY